MLTNVQSKVPQRRRGSLTEGVAADHAAALLPAALAFDLVGGRVVLGHAPGHVRPCPLWPLKDFQFSNPAALAMAFTRRAIWDSDSPKTFSLLATTGRSDGGRGPFMAAGVIATTAP